jgi:hypothetical protein
MNSQRMAALAIGLLFAACMLETRVAAQSNCQGYQAWVVQANPQTDAVGKSNINYPDADATYWVTNLIYSQRTVITVMGQFPLARYMSFELYDAKGNYVDGIDDVQINPDPGQNNPYVSGEAQGTYTLSVVFGSQPREGSASNTIYTGNVNAVALVYRLYYPDTPTNLPGGPVNPVLPEVIAGGTALSTCPPAPIISPITDSLYGRLNLIDYIGTPPANQPSTPAAPKWSFTVTGPNTPYSANVNNSYLSASIDRAFLTAPYNYNMVVIQMMPPTYDNTQAGVAPYAPAQVRYWSMCENEPMSTAVVRCVPDNQAAALNGMATFVICDPSYVPSAAVLSQWGATWIPWGAMENSDVIYNDRGQALTNADGVFYYGEIIYRQTLANPDFTQSIANVANLPAVSRQAAMGAYYPSIGYCTSVAFAQYGAGCIGQ